jgi:hypothetical protein
VLAVCRIRTDDRADPLDAGAQVTIEASFADVVAHAPPVLLQLS